METLLLKKSREIAKKVYERINAEDLPPTPENYELWYVYFSEGNSDIVRAIDLLVSRKEKITAEHCSEIYLRFLSEKQESEHVRQAGDKIQETIKEVSSIVQSVKDSSQSYSTALDNVASKLSSDIDRTELETILKSVMDNTREMMKRNEALEKKLAESSVNMQEMQRDLDTVRKEAMTDSLTRLANRKAFDAELKRLTMQAEEGGVTFSLLMMDIDHFKSFNDNFGHQVGDQVLRLVAKTLTDGVKGRDVAARYGGEEFAIILPETVLQGGMKVGDLLREAVASKEVINRNTGEKLGRITLSGGVAQFVAGESTEDLIERADAALYTAKHNGRNQIAAAATPGGKKSG